MRGSFRSISMVAMVVAMVLSACSAAPAAPTATLVPTTTITLAGSGGGTTILRQVVPAFTQQNPAFALDFLPSSGGAPAKQGVLDGTLDIAILLSADIAGEAQPGLEILTLAADPIAFVHHADLAIENLTTEQLTGIYMGQITNWSEVGGPDAAIVVLTREEAEGSTKILRATLFGENSWSPNAVVLTKAGDLRDAVAKTPYSIGFGSYGDFAINGLTEQIIMVNAIHPKEAATGRYPIPARTLAIAYASNRAEPLKPLITFMKGEQAATALQQIGLTPTD